MYKLNEEMHIIVSWSDIPELVDPIMIFLIDVAAITEAAEQRISSG